MADENTTDQNADDSCIPDNNQSEAVSDKMKMGFGIAFMVCVTAIVITVLVLIFN